MPETLYGHLSEGEIRVLVLPKGKPEDRLKLRLSTVHFSNLPDYEALSYTWASNLPPEDVTINGVEQVISGNLGSALHQLRLLDEDRPLWADAICIDQQNTQERSRQVGMMGQIFSSATRVVVWLGPADEDSDYVLQHLAPNSDLFCNPRFLFGLRALCERPFWRRLWIVQEVTLNAADPLIVCGQMEVSWAQVHAAVFFFLENWLRVGVLTMEMWEEYLWDLAQELQTWKNDPRDLAVKSSEHQRLIIAENLELIEELDVSVQQQPPGDAYVSFALKDHTEAILHANTILHDSNTKLFRSLEHLENLQDLREDLNGFFEIQLSNTQNFHVSDPRDRIFGILGISKYELDTHITPDYSKSAVLVYSEIVASIIVRPARLYKSHSLSGNVKLGLPSWVPNFNQSDMLISDKRHPYYLYRSDVRSQSQVWNDEGALISFDQELKSMKTYGLPLGSIVAMQSMPNARGLTEVWVRNVILDLVQSGHKVDDVLEVLSSVPSPHGVLELTLDNRSQLLRFVDDESAPTDGLKELVKNIRMHNDSKLFFRLDNGKLGVTVNDEEVQVGDNVVGLFGLNLPFILRDLGNGKWRMISLARLGRHTLGHDISPEVKNIPILCATYGLREYQIV